jgi:lipoate-protein ligase B
MIDTISFWGINAKTNSANRGVWVAGRKLGSIGIAVKRSVTYHGFALNVNTDLTPFEWIYPCGLKHIKITSISDILGRPIDMEKVRNKLKSQMASAFGLQLESISPLALKKITSERNETRFLQHDNDLDSKTILRKLYKRHETTIERFFV